MIAAGFTPAILQRSPAANQLQNENHQSDEKQNVNVSAEHVESHETEQPQNQQNDEDSPKHINLSVRVDTNDSFYHAQARLTKIGRAAAHLYLPAFASTARKSQPFASNSARAAS